MNYKTMGEEKNPDYDGNNNNYYLYVYKEI